MTPYIEAAGADGIIAEALPAADAGRCAWAALDESDKGAYLMRAMLALEALPYRGKKAAAEQAEAFPRAGQQGVPEAVRRALTLEACALASVSADADIRGQLMAQGVTSFSLGGLSESYGHTGGPALMSAPAKALLRPYVTGVAPIV
jgi:hypothetical protein